MRSGADYLAALKGPRRIYIDGRKVLQITPRGKALVETLAPLALALNSRLLSSLSENAATRFSRDLETVVNTVENCD